MALSGNSYHYAIDPFLLFCFSRFRWDDKVADLGTATAILPLLVIAQAKADKVVGVEIQSQLVARAQQNIEYNELQDKISLLHADICEVHPKRLLPHESFDVVLTNPPYRRAGTGRIAPDDERAACRHELHGGLDDFLACAYYLLRNGGRFCLIYLAERLPELLARMRERKLEPKRIRMVHSRSGDPAKLVLVEGRRNGKPGAEIEPPLYIYDGEDYSDEMQEMMRNLPRIFDVDQSSESESPC